MVTTITVGRDDYPKGTGSGSRSYLAGRHWRPARRPVPTTAKGRVNGKMNWAKGP